MINNTNIQLASHDACTGCAACASVCPNGCISMKEDREGFLQPHIDADACIGCHRCEKTCPIVTPITIPADFETQVYAAINKDEDVRMRSSSGGMFHALAKWTIEQGGVVFGAAFEGIHLKHQYVETLDDVRKFMGSKYVQSDVQESYREVKRFLEDDRWVLYSGTPCQIAGLKRSLGKEYEKLFTIDLICYGVPSPTIFEKYMTRLLRKLKAKDVKDIGFRKNTSYLFFFFFLDENAVWREYGEGCYENPYFAYFMRLLFRSSCYQCPFRSTEASYADFTIGDCWDVEETHPKMADGKGVSIIIVHSHIGHTIYNDIQQFFDLEEENISVMHQRYDDAKQRELHNKNTRPWRLSNRLAQYIPLEYMRWIYLRDRFEIRLQRKVNKLFNKK